MRLAKEFGVGGKVWWGRLGSGEAGGEGGGNGTAFEIFRCSEYFGHMLF